MVDVRGAIGDDACRGLRSRRPASRRGDPHPRPVPVARVVLYSAPGCHLCDAARRVVHGVREEQPFELAEVDISGDAALEARFRELIPVVEIGGERAFTYFVPPDALRRKLAQASAREGSS